MSGGYHHCSANKGGGFCVYADITLSIKLLRKNFSHIKKIMIIDLGEKEKESSKISFSFSFNEQTHTKETDMNKTNWMLTTRTLLFWTCTTRQVPKRKKKKNTN
jgi:vacuolar-type H+-ATPase catalytic subunit A/Vma1